MKKFTNNKQLIKDWKVKHPAFGLFIKLFDLEVEKAAYYEPGTKKKEKRGFYDGASGGNG